MTMSEAWKILFILACLGLIACPALAALPVAQFSADPWMGNAPLDVAFTDISTGNPAAYAWYFGDEDYSASAWAELPAASWASRAGYAAATLPNGTIVLAGGGDMTGEYSDTYISPDNGTSWSRVNATGCWTPRRSLSMVALPDNHLVLMGGYDNTYTYRNDTWRSTDGGTTWTLANASGSWSARSSFAAVALPDGSIVLMGGDDRNDVWRSVDEGATWTRLTAAAGWAGRYGHAAVTLPDGSIVLMGGCRGSTSTYYNDVWRSTDRGATWTCINASAGWAGRCLFAAGVLPDGSIVIAGGFDGSGMRNDVYRSTDSGATWTSVKNAEWSTRHCSGVVTRTGSFVIMGGVSGGSYRNDVWSLSTVSSTARNPSHTYTAAGTPRVTLRVSNTDGSDTTSRAVAVRPLASFSGSQAEGNPNQVFFTGSSTGSATGWAWYFGDEDWTAGTWNLQTGSPEWGTRRGQVNLLLPDGSIVLIGGSNNAGWNQETWISKNKGVNWTRVNASPGWAARTDFRGVALQDGTLLVMGGYLSTGSGGVYMNDTWRSTDSGATWTCVSTDGGWTARDHFAAVALPDGSVVLMGGEKAGSVPLGDVWRSADQGATWTCMTGDAEWQNRSSHSAVALPDGSIVLMGGWNPNTEWFADVWRSTDTGATWSVMTSHAAWAPAFSGVYGATSCVLPDGSIVFMGGNNGGFANPVYRSADMGGTWTNMGSPPWGGRAEPGSVVLTDGTILLMGGITWSGGWSYYGDVWRLETASSQDKNTTHTYASLGTYPVTLRAYNNGHYNSTVKNVGVLLVPDLTAITPARKKAGSPAFNLTVNGTGFTNASRVRWNGANRTAYYLSSTILKARIKAKDIRKAGKYKITVLNPGPGGGISNAIKFRVT